MISAPAGELISVCLGTGRAVSISVAITEMVGTPGFLPAFQTPCRVIVNCGTTSHQVETHGQADEGPGRPRAAARPVPSATATKAVTQHPARTRRELSIRGDFWLA